MQPLRFLLFILVQNFQFVNFPFAIRFRALQVLLQSGLEQTETAGFGHSLYVNVLLVRSYAALSHGRVRSSNACSLR